MTVLGVDAGSPTLTDAEHLVLELAGRLGAAPGAVLCTHVVRSGPPHYAVSLELPGPPDPALLPAPATYALPGESGDPAAMVAAAHAERRSGRAVRFPGQELLTGRVPVADVLARTAVQEVRVIAGGSADGADLLTLGFVRPEFSGGRLVLVAQPAGPGLVAPFELEDQKPCCVAHGGPGGAQRSTADMSG